MKNTDLYKKLMSSYTYENLQKITQKIIALHKNTQTNVLALLMNGLGVEQPKDRVHSSKAFYTLMMAYHPDRINVYRSGIEKLHAAGDIESLKQYAHIFTALELESTLVVLKQSRSDSSTYSDIWENVCEESDRYENGDIVDEEQEDDIDAFDDGAPRNNFFSAFKRQVYGNTKIELPFYYLEDLDTLDLAGSGIDDLDGIRYCKHLVSLELSANRITDVSELASLGMMQELYLAGNRIGYIDGLSFLSNLRAVDLSHNAIDDLSPLSGLEHLEYVNVTGNPIPRQQIDLLQKKGIVTLW